MEDPKDKIRSNSSKRCVKSTPSQKIFPNLLAKILMGIAMDPILNFLERAERELSENVYKFLSTSGV